MSIEAQRWAWAQNIPSKPKFLLVTLADQTDEQTGMVCYQDTSVGFFIKKCSITERSFYRCMAALVRHGYVVRQSGRGRGNSSSYWLRLDREPTPIEAWTWSADLEADDGEDIQDIEKPDTVSPFADGDKTCQNDRKNLPSVAGHKDSKDSPKNQPADEKPIKGFSRHAQDVAIEKSKPPPAGPIFVREGTPAWTAWKAFKERERGRPWNLSTGGSGENRGKTGWYFPSLFPPKTAATGTPPPTDPLSDETAASIRKAG